jgi:hypothetical protein
MHEVISAFLDNEPFDPRELADALATEEGRDMLLDVVAMRALAQVPDVPAADAGGRPRVTPRGAPVWLLAAAAVLVAALAGYGAGRQVHPAQTPVPDATATFTFQPGVNWTESPAEGGN